MKTEQDVINLIHKARIIYNQQLTAIHNGLTSSIGILYRELKALSENLVTLRISNKQIDEMMIFALGKPQSVQIECADSIISLMEDQIPTLEKRIQDQKKIKDDKKQNTIVTTPPVKDDQSSHIFTLEELSAANAASSGRDDSKKVAEAEEKLKRVQINRQDRANIILQGIFSDPQDRSIYNVLINSDPILTIVNEKLLKACETFTLSYDQKGADIRAQVINKFSPIIKAAMLIENSKNVYFSNRKNEEESDSTNHKKKVFTRLEKSVIDAIFIDDKKPAEVITTIQNALGAVTYNKNILADSVIIEAADEKPTIYKGTKFAKAIHELDKNLKDLHRLALQAPLESKTKSIIKNDPKPEDRKKTAAKYSPPQRNRDKIDLINDTKPSTPSKR